MRIVKRLGENTELSTIDRDSTLSSGEVVFVFMLALLHLMCFPVKPVAKLTIPSRQNFHGETAKLR